MDFSQYALLGFVIAGVTELLNRLRDRDLWAVATITSAAVVGALFGAFHYAGVPDVPTGIAAGFGASGALKALSVFGNKSVAEPSKVVK